MTEGRDREGRRKGVIQVRLSFVAHREKRERERDGETVRGRERSDVGIVCQSHSDTC